MCWVPAFAALADDTRMRIVETPRRRGPQRQRPRRNVPISQPAISRHLRLLRDSGAVEVEPAGKERIYKLRPEAVSELAGWAERIRLTWEARFGALGVHLDRTTEQRDGR
jgi:DNA-binding transcriptional ArsR family regulator